MLKCLEHLSYEKRLRNLRLVSMEKMRLREISSMSINARKEYAMKIEIGSVQCPVQSGTQSGISSSDKFRSHLGVGLITLLRVSCWSRSWATWTQRYLPTSAML